MNKILIATIPILILLLGATIYFSKREPDSNPQSPSSISTKDKEDIEQNADFENKPKLLIGDENAKVKIIEYIDFKCPNCNKFHRDAGKRVREEYVASGKVAIEIRNYPFIGPDSGRAARGAYCANDQGVFSSYHHNVFDYMWDNYYKSGNFEAEIEDVLTAEVLEKLVSGYIPNAEQFRTCLSDEAKNKFIDADLLLGADDKITGTPGFIIGDQKITGPSNFNTFKTLLDIQLQ
jgi:protein-disulfide isomerase